MPDDTYRPVTTKVSRASPKFGVRMVASPSYARSPTRHPHETPAPHFRRGPPARGSDRKAALRRLSQAPDLATGRILGRGSGDSAEGPQPQP